jgi:hypothetical protein
MSSTASALSVVNPTFDYDGMVKREPDSTPHLETLSKKVIGLLWNAKPFGDVALQTASERIASQFEDVEFRFYSGHQPHPPKLLAQVAEEVDAAILATAD